MRNGWVFASVLATAMMASALVARADVCADGQHSCDDTGAPECWFNPSRSEYACSPRGWNHCGARYKSYSCPPSANCLGDGSAPPYCSSPSSFIKPLPLPGVTPASFRYVQAKGTSSPPAPRMQRFVPSKGRESLQPTSKVRARKQRALRKRQRTTSPSENVAVQFPSVGYPETSPHFECNWPDRPGF